MLKLKKEVTVMENKMFLEPELKIVSLLPTDILTTSTETIIPGEEDDLENN